MTSQDYNQTAPKGNDQNTTPQKMFDLTTSERFVLNLFRVRTKEDCDSLREYNETQNFDCLTENMQIVVGLFFNQDSIA